VTKNILNIHINCFSTVYFMKDSFEECAFLLVGNKYGLAWCVQVAWREAMKEVKAVRDTITALETHVKFLKGYLGPNPEFDNL